MTTNYDWAAETLLAAHPPFPANTQTIDNVARWMAAENPASSWFEDNDPLNVGDFSAGGEMSFPDLGAAAVATAKVIRQENMSDIAHALDTSAPLWDFSTACAASPWSTGGYHGRPGYIASVPLPAVVNAPGTPNPQPQPQPLEDGMIWSPNAAGTGDWLISGDKKAGIPNPDAMAAVQAQGIQEKALPAATLNALVTVKWGLL